MIDLKNINFINILFSTCIVELIILIFFRFTKSKFSVKAINNWYDKLRWSAVLLDIFIFIIGFYINIFISNKLNINKYYYFLLSQILIQMVHDILFYLIFILGSKKGNNKVMDEFKSYAENTGFGAILGDSWMYLMGIPILLLSSKLNKEFLIFITTLCLYIIGYLIYQIPNYKIPTYYIEFLIPIVLNLMFF